MTKFMKPEDCHRYAPQISAQRIREIMKRNIVDLGIVMNLNGKRYQYFIYPSKFFKWIDAEVPKEWRQENEELN